MTDFYALTTKIFVTIALGYAQLGPAANSKCQPSGWDSTSQYFSPGICPSSYEVACSTIVGAETQATCCPVGWSCQKSTNWPQYATDACTVDGSDLPSSTLSFNSANGTSTSKYGVVNTAAGGLNAYGISIRWKAADFVATPTASASSSSPTTSPAPATTSGAIATQFSSSGAGASSGLSAGAKAGIGIGAAIGVLALLALMFLLFRRHRGQHVVPTEESVPVECKDSNYGHYVPDGSTNPNLGSSPLIYHEVDGTSTNRVEAHGTPRSELL